VSRFDEESTRRRRGPKKRIIGETNANLQNFADSSRSEQLTNPMQISITN